MVNIVAASEGVNLTFTAIVAVGDGVADDDAVGVDPPAYVIVPKPPLVEESQPGPTNEYLNEAPVKVPEAVTVNVAVPVESKMMLQL
jgi:hypothetical protein